MPDKMMLTLGAFVKMTDDAMLIIDPRTWIIRYASPRAIDLVGPVLGERNKAVAEVFVNANDRFASFIRDALTVTEPIMSSVSLLDDDRIFSAKGRRLSVENSAPQVLVLLNAEPELSNRFRLLAEKIKELRAEVGRRVVAETELSEHVLSLRRSVTVIKHLSEIDIATGDHLDTATVAIATSLKSPCCVVISADLGKLRVAAATGMLAAAFENNPSLDLPLAEFMKSAAYKDDRWKQALVSSIMRASGTDIDLSNAMLFPLSVAGEVRGALFCLLDSTATSNATLRLEGEFIAETLGGLMARAEIEARLIHAQKLQAIGELTGGIAHDFNNILAVVLGNAELLLSEFDNIDLDLSREIRDAAMRGATLTSRLLSFARKQPLRPEVTDLNALLREFDPLMRRTLKENIGLELISAGGLWKSQVDRNQLENAVLNLVLNARDAMSDGGRLTIETGNVWLDSEYAERHSEVRPGQYVMIAVSDTGHGMAPEIAQEAFTPFFTTKDVGQGSGLGLSMVFGFVKQSLGHVKIYSEAGLGTTIRMYFPRHHSDVADPDSHLVLDAETTLATKKRILVVEDDPGVLKYLIKSLEQLGYETIGVATGDAAAEILKNQFFDVLLTDVVLPGKRNGVALAEIARQVAPEMPVLFMSGYTENAIVHHGRLDAGVEFISKPFTREQLAKRLKILTA